MVSFRAVVATDPVTGTIGIGVLLKQGISFDAAFSYQGNLGFQPHFGITYTLKKKKIIPYDTGLQAPESSVETKPAQAINAPEKKVRRAIH